MATHSSILAWRIPWREEPGRLQSMRSQRVRHDWATSLTHSLTHWSQYSQGMQGWKGQRPSSKALRIKHQKKNSKPGWCSRGQFQQVNYTHTVWDQKAHENTLHMANYQINANPNNTEESPHHGQNAHHQKKPQRLNAAEVRNKRGSSHTLGGGVNECSHCGKQHGGSLKVQHTGTVWSSNPSLGLKHGGKKIIIWNASCTPIFRVALFTRAEIKNQPARPESEKWRLSETARYWNTPHM